MTAFHWTTVAVWAAAATGASAQDATKIEALEKRIAELEAKQPKDAAGKDAGGGDMKWNDFSLGGSRFQIYGFLHTNAYYDDSRPNSVTLPSFIKSEDQTAPAGFRAPVNENDFTISAKLTRFGINFTGPKISGLGDPALTGKLETDFYNAAVTDSREALRIRVAYLQMHWDGFNFYAGQMWDVIAPIFPVVNPDNVMWNTGNLGDRRPQLRGEWIGGGESTKFNVQGMVGNTGAIDGQDLDPAGGTGSGYKDGDQAGVPTFQGRAAIITPVSDWKKNLEFGAWAHRAKEQTDTVSAAANATHFNSSAYGVDLQVPLFRDQVWFRGELWTGRNLGDVRGGILQDINVNGEEVRSQGGWAEVGTKVPGLEHVEASVGYSFDNPNNDDLINNATTASRTCNTVWYGALRFNYKPISFGIDYLRWTTRYLGFSDGTDNRFQAFISYAF